MSKRNPPIVSIGIINLNNRNTNCYNQDFDLYFSQQEQECKKRESCPSDEYFNWLKEKCVSNTNVRYYAPKLPRQLIEDEFTVQEALKEARIFEPYLNKSSSKGFTAID